MRYYRPGDEVRVDLQDPRTIDRYAGWMELIGRWFRYQVHGLDRIPRTGPALIVMNHGPLPLDAALLGLTIYREHGRLPRALTDHLVFRLPWMRELFLALGASDGRHEVAEALLADGHAVIVMPGGAPEAFKASRKAYQLYWRQRTGFARLALRAQAPVVPAVCIGIEELYTLPLDLFELGRKLTGVRSLPLGPLWGWGPLPRRVPLTQWIGEPILPEGAPEDEDAVLRLRDRVTDAAEALIAFGLRERAEGRDPEGRR